MILALCALCAAFTTTSFAAEIYVAGNGSDRNPGSREKPLATLDAARNKVRGMRGTVSVLVRGGTYYLAKPIVFGPEDSRGAGQAVTYKAYPGEKVTISGAAAVPVKWLEHEGNVKKAHISGDYIFDQLFLGGKKLHMARYPNFDPAASHFGGYSADVLSPAKIKSWKKPAGAFIHAMHKHEWGDYHYRVTGKSSDTTLSLEGGYQNNRQMGMHDKYRFIENLQEELDAPDEWYYDATSRTLYVYAPGDVREVLSPQIRHLFEFRGTAEKPVRNTIYNIPRAGINVSEGTWGGHLIEFNDVFDTVLETGDHGSFNSWGRDRFWHPVRERMDSLAAAHPELILLDAGKTIVIRNNRFRCDHGWDIDLDDGSSNYHIYNNLCLNGGLKLREGFQRVVENNIMVNNSFHPHVWFARSGDVFRKNIVTKPYAPIRVNEWGKEVDYNLFPDEAALEKARRNGTDAHSLAGDPMFMDAAAGDYRVKPGSPAFQIGFVNFPMDEFGVVSPELKSKAAQVPLPVAQSIAGGNAASEMAWLGGKLRNVSGLGDRSAYGLPDEKGVVVEAVTENSILARAGMKPGDVIRVPNHRDIATVTELMDVFQEINWMGEGEVAFFRNQAIQKLKVPFK